MSGSHFAAQSRTFLDWFKAWQGTTFHDNIKIEDLRGRGAVATADIPEDTVLFSIPRKAIISVESSNLSKRIPEVFEDSTTPLEDADNEADEEGGETSVTSDSWVSLILVMMYEHLQGEKSPWKPYLDVLPSTFDTPMFWSENELSELQASAIASKIGKDEAENMFRGKILPVVQSHAGVFYPEGAARLCEDDLIELCHRMGSTIMAYAFDLENDEDRPDSENEDSWVEDREGKLMMGMVPMADILNADAEFNVGSAKRYVLLRTQGTCTDAQQAHVNHGDDTLTVTSLRPITAGEEVLNYYGPLGNGELLRRYGYVTSKHARYDVVEISWDLVVSVLKDTLKLDEASWGMVLNQFDPEEIEDTSVIDRDLDEPDSTGRVRGESKLTRLPKDLQEQLSAFLKATRKVSPAAVPDKQKRDQIILTVIQRVCELRTSQYPTGYAYDFDLLSQNRVAGRQKMAVVVRWGEKVLLKEVADLSKMKLEEMKLNADGGEPAEKKRKTV
ncbi:hypothetical protein DL764_005883 [Monosporascus ibericus]|uniref:SET domain-containing protein n=1 Tax=Monosporascus ibericus TaxID=155417 RepID=A0A4Q4T723_9PEZI|nr:hypothetical protein DL764_005883 [Monosporascus ibericus]